MNISLTTAQRYVLTVIEARGVKDPDDGKKVISTREIRQEYEKKFPGKWVQTEVERSIRSLINKGCLVRTAEGSRYVLGRVKQVMSLKEIEG